MFNNKDISILLRELIEENPDLKGSEGKLKEAIITLNELDSKLVPSLEFKKELRKKIETLSGVESKSFFTSKFNFRFLIPVFSLCFAVFWFYYILLVEMRIYVLNNSKYKRFPFKILKILIKIAKL